MSSQEISFPARCGGRIRMRTVITANGEGPSRIDRLRTSLQTLEAASFVGNQKPDGGQGRLALANKILVKRV